ncbi:MAG: tetratricopeptide repeat protein [Opitutaceae bacterium]
MADAFRPDPDLPQAHFEAARLSESGNAQLARGRVADALAAHRRAAALWPQSGAIQCNLGNALQAARLPEEAEAAFRRALAVQADMAEAHNNLGAILLQRRRPAEALAALDRAIALRPGYADAWYNRGNGLIAIDQPAEAEAAFRRALALAPGHARARLNLSVLASNRGNALVAANRPREALHAYREALEADPDSPDIRYNESLARLVLGEFAAGWTGYESRSACKGRKVPRVFGAPRWDARTPLSGRSILLYAEQGLGDTLQFARYIPLLAARGAKVHLEAQRSLHALLRASFPDLGSLVGKGDPLPGADLHFPLLSLPGAFGTSLDSIPSGSGYLRPPADRIRRWRTRFAAEARPRVGLVWSGAAGHQNDLRRSLTFERLARALPTSGIRYVSLQKEVRETDLPSLRAFPSLVALGSEVSDFADTAAAAAELDLILSVDTSVAHLGGGLGRPTWILLPFSPDWRWLLDRTDSPWYPTVRLFRQSEPDRWDPVLDHLHEALTRWARDRPDLPAR